MSKACIIRSSEGIHEVKGDGSSTSFVRSLDIQWPGKSGNDDDVNDYQWRVHLGDVVAVSADCLTLPKLQDWRPDHLTKSSKHWKVGLVLALTKETTSSNKNSTKNKNKSKNDSQQTKFSCAVQWLHKALDTNFKKELVKTYRVHSNHMPQCAMPYVLLNTNETGTIDPLQLLPMKITMMTSGEIKPGILYHDDDRFSFSFHCAKRIEGGKLVHEESESWTHLNPGSGWKDGVPRPLRLAWMGYAPCKPSNNQELLSIFIQAFANIKRAKYKAYIIEKEKKRKLLEQERLQAEQDEQQKLDEKTEASDTSTLPKSNKRKLSAGKIADSKKRVRIQEPTGEKSSQAKPVSSGSKKKRNLQTSILKGKAANVVVQNKKKGGVGTKLPKTTKAKTSKVETPKKKKSKAATAKDTNSTGITLPRKGRGRSKSRTSASTLKVTPQSESIYSTPSFEYFERVDVAIDQDIFEDNDIRPLHETFSIVVGQILPIRSNESIAEDWHPFRVKWGIAQVVSIYLNNDKEWAMGVRWFYRFSELETVTQNKLKKDFSRTLNLLEKMEVLECPVEAALPAHVCLTSLKSWKKDLPTINQDDGLPILYSTCRHVLNGSKIEPVHDWTNYHKHLSDVRDPLVRGFQSKGIAKRVADKYLEQIRNRIGDSTDGSDSDSAMSVDNEISAAALAVIPISPNPIYERQKMKFYEGIRLNIEKISLHKDIKPKTDRWTLKVGYVVPIRLPQKPLPYYEGVQEKCWYPFQDGWNPGQVVSIYQTEKGEWMMQIRWFNRFRDMSDDQKEGLSYFDQPHVVFETEVYDKLAVASAFPGRVILTSRDSNDWEISTSLLAGLPLIPRLCGHICLDEAMDNAMDWTNYDIAMKSLPAPLTRGLLLNPRNRDSKDMIIMLSRHYIKHIRLRGADPDEDVMRRWSSGVTLDTIGKKGIEFDPKRISAEIGDHFYTGNETASVRRQFSLSLKLTTPFEYMASPRKGRKRAKGTTVTCNVGDIVCFYDETAQKASDHILMKNLRFPWHPYRVSWSFGQVLCIYRDIGGNDSTPFVEVRRFYRASELPELVQQSMPTTDEYEREEVFESDDTVERLSACHLLGTADIYLGHHSKPANHNPDAQDSSSLMTCSCSYFFLASHKQFQPLFSSGFSPGLWFDRLQERGFQLSKMLKRFDGLGQSMPSKTSEGKTLDLSLLLGKESIEKETTGKMILVQLASSQRNRSNLSFYADATIAPKWSEFEYADLFYPPKDQGPGWKITVGDLVAVRDENARKPRSLYPFRGNWSAGQVLAIYSYSKKKGGVVKDYLQFEVRCLDISVSSASELALPQINQGTLLDIKCMKSADLLGPLLPAGREVDSEFDWGTVPKHLPSARCWVSNPLSFELTHAIGLSKMYDLEDRSKLLQALGVEKMVESGKDAQSARKDGRPRSLGDAWTSVEPIHLDVSELRMYYSEVSLLPTDRISIRKERYLEQKTWAVKMGDAVLVRCDGAKRFPMDCNWSVAEIVAIWKEFESEKCLERARHQTLDTEPDICSLRIEIRWLYERRDIVGFTPSESLKEVYEVFETDHVDVLDAAKSLIAPACLHSDSKSMVESDTFMGLPIQSFLCRQFWSTTRKSLIPCGSLEARGKRGLLYSKSLPEELRRKTTKRDAPAGLPTTRRLTWKDSMEKIISKLTLKDASKGAYERGEALIGREKELQQLLSFFRSAIRGDPGSGGIKSSMFLAGAPGVGKTACVRAAITRLRTEQARGEIPKFKFIPLNGMEMRHPFEAYVKLWEALTGRKHVGSYEKACAKLEAHFTNPATMDETTDRTVSVLLLDEIDYLITEKQTVLYNFFDWPKRAAEVPNGRRLVVVGISNTLNLAEQLMPSVQSRVGSDRCCFKAYNLKDTIAILKSKIAEASPDFSMFEEDAIIFAAKKTAALSGDIRKAFQIGRASAELVLNNHEADKDKQFHSGTVHPKVRISDVQKASRDSFNTALVKAVSFSTAFQALLLVALASLRRSTGREDGSFDIKDVLMKMEGMAGASGDPQYSPPPSFGETIHLLNLLGENNLVELSTETSTSISFRSSSGGSGGAWPMTKLAVDEHTVTSGLKNTPHKVMAEMNLPSLY